MVICYLFQNWEVSDRIRYEISYGMGPMEWPVLCSAADPADWREGVPALTSEGRMPSGQPAKRSRYEVRVRGFEAVGPGLRISLLRGWSRVCPTTRVSHRVS